MRTITVLIISLGFISFAKADPNNIMMPKHLTSAFKDQQCDQLAKTTGSFDPRRATHNDSEAVQ